MNILCVAACEDRANLDAQILKQTVAPNRTIFYVDPTPAKGINNRRKRIAENQDKLKEIVAAYKPDFVWQLEGDCDLPDDCLERLIGRYIQYGERNFGYISGIQVGRHGLYCLGAWQVAADRKSFNSIDHKLEGIQPIDATGFYCLLAPTDVWLAAQATWDGEPYGPDVNWGLSIKQNKYVDMGLHIGHITKTGIIKPENPSTCTAHFSRQENGKWGYKTT